MRRRSGLPRLGRMDTARPERPSPGWVIAPTSVAVLSASFPFVAGGGGHLAVALPVAAVALSASVTAGAVLRARRQRRRFEHRLASWAGERAAQAERLRIARELHDLVSHGLGLITVRAAVARTAGDGDPAEQAAALADVERVGRETTTELRRMLSVLRDPEAAAESAPLRPAESMADLPSIVEAARDAGMDVRLSHTEPDAISPGAQLAVCAVVREALHNVLRHAGPTGVAVSVVRDGPAVAVTVRDHGPVAGWKAEPGAGHGLEGLRERVAALGGTLEAGPSGDGFVLAARLPDGAGL